MVETGKLFAGEVGSLVLVLEGDGTGEIESRRRSFYTYAPRTEHSGATQSRLDASCEMRCSRVA